MGRALRRLPALLGLAAAAVTGLLWRASGQPVRVTTVRGQAAELAGHGLYRYDTVFAAASNTAVDAVVLVLAVPLLLVAWRWRRTGSPRGSVLLTGVLAYLLYLYANYALGVAYNPLHLAYVSSHGRLACSGSSPCSSAPTGGLWR